jgi:hypothetical protein
MVLVAPQSTEQEGPEEILGLLRQGSGQRPRFDPGLAGGLRAWLEDSASVVVRARGEDAPPWHVGLRHLIGEPGAAGSAAERPQAVLTACLVHALFRQIVVTGAIDDPLGDAVSALRVDPSQTDVVTKFDALTADERRSLAWVVESHVSHMRMLVPRLHPAWMPRTGDRVALPLAGGRVVVHGTFDLLVGAPTDDRASQCAVGLTTTGPWDRARRKLHLLALLETLRSGSPPFRVALLDSGTGRYGVEDVLEEHLGAVVAHVTGRLTEMANATH